jgi:hypothetical protein
LKTVFQSEIRNPKSAIIALAFNAISSAVSPHPAN